MTGDSFLKPGPAFGKGVAYVDEFNLGRYWRLGPQKTLFVPGPVLKPGRSTHELFFFETEAAGELASLVDAPEWA
jgi:beta-galactosidase